MTAEVVSPVAVGLGLGVALASAPGPVQAVLLAEALGRMPEESRELLILRHLEGLTFPEVARRLGRTVDSVKKQWPRALAALRRLLEGQG